MVGLDILTKALEDYARDGWAVIPGVFKQRNFNNLRFEADALVNAVPKQVQFRNNQPALFFNPCDFHPTFWGLAYSPDMAIIVNAFLGNRTRHIINQIYYRNSGDKDEFAWHQDVIFRPKDDFHGIDSSYLQTIICLDDIEDNGAIEFISGSQSFSDGSLVQSDGESLRSFVRGSLKGTKVRARAGDVLVWHPLVIHGSERNESGKSRKSFMNGFAREDSVIAKDKYKVYGE